MEAAAALSAALQEFDSLGRQNSLSYVFEGYESFKPSIDKVKRFEDDDIRSLLVEDSKFYRVPLLGVAGLTTRHSKAQNTTGDPVLFYKRLEVKEIWDAIDKVLVSKEDFKALFVKGQPGTGKSTAIWWKILSILTEEGRPKNILWVSLNKDCEPEASVYFQGTNYFDLGKKLKRRHILTFIVRVPVELVVIDGMLAGAQAQELRANLIAWMRNDPKRHAVFSSSSKFDDPRYHQNKDIALKEVHSWKLEEFRDAFVKDEIPTEICERCSSLLFEEIGLSPSESEEVETDCGVVVTMEQIHGKAKEIWEALSTLPEMESTQESITAPIATATNAPAPVEPSGANPPANATAAELHAPEEDEQMADNQPSAKRTLPPAAAKGGQACEEMDLDEDEDEDGNKNSDDSEGNGSKKRQKMLSKADIFEAIGGRYKYSGGSARWMFNYDRKQMDDLLDKYCQKSSNRTAVANGEVGPTSDASTNYFFGSALNEQGKTEYFLVSQRAVEKLFSHAEETVFQGLYSFASKLENPSFLGWVVEADFFFQVDRARNAAAPFQPLQIHCNGEDSEGLPTHPSATREWQHTKNKNLLGKAIHDAKVKVRREAIQKLHRIVQTLVPQKPGEAFVCKPSTWNQGGYDAFFVQFVGGRTDTESEKVQGHIHLRFIQVTKGKTHELKLDYFISVIQCFNVAGYEVDSVEIGFVLTKFNLDFSLGTVTGEYLLKDCVIFGSNDKWGKVTAEKISCYQLGLSKSLIDSHV